MTLRVIVYFMWWKWCKLEGHCTEDDVRKERASLEWMNEQELRCLWYCTNSNSSFVGVLSLNPENHLLPTLWKCLCIFYTLTHYWVTNPLVWTHRFSQKGPQKQASTTAVPQTKMDLFFFPWNGCCQRLV